MVGLVTVATLATLASTGCGGARPEHSTSPGCSAGEAARRRPPDAASPRAAARAYLADLTSHRFDRAATAILPCTPRQDASLRRLWKFSVGIPSGHARAQVRPLRPRKHQPPSERLVRVTLFFRFGRAPYSSWIKATTRTLRLDRRRGRWFLTADVTRAAHGDLAAYGLSSFSRPLTRSGRRATVVYSWKAPGSAVRQVLATADHAIGPLLRRFGGGRAALRPVIFLVQGRRQGERLAHIQLGKVRTPAGWQYSSYAYVDLPEWEDLDPGDQRSMVVHELTHVVTRAVVADAPHSMAEGIAMYEENAWRRAHGFAGVDLTGMAAVYAHGFPTTIIWARRETDWGLRNTFAIHFAYIDAMLMTRAVIERHGGYAAFRRLAAQFAARERPHHDFTTADVDAAFRAALGVPFAQVEAQARAYAVAAAR